MVNDLLGNIKVTLETLRDVARGAPLNLHAWRRMKSRLMVQNENGIYLKAYPNLQFIYLEKLREVVLASYGVRSHHPLLDHVQIALETNLHASHIHKDAHCEAKCNND